MTAQAHHTVIFLTCSISLRTSHPVLRTAVGPTADPPVAFQGPTLLGSNRYVIPVTFHEPTYALVMQQYVHP
jgi:hypothetical protein